MPVDLLPSGWIVGSFSEISEEDRIGRVESVVVFFGWGGLDDCAETSEQPMLALGTHRFGRQSAV